jgi:hypothetical protein
MVSSGTYNFAASNGEIVLAAYERIQIRVPEIRQEHMASARRELNFLLSAWSNSQPNLWKVTLNQINLIQGVATYSVPANTIMILDAYRSVNTGTPSQTNIYMTPISRTEYASYPEPQVQGPPIVYWFDRLIAPTVTMYETPDDSGPYIFNYYACIQMQDANLPGGETPDIPYRWIDAFVAGMAHRLARIYAPPLEAQREKDADKAWQIAATQDTENTPLTIAPAIASYYRR